MKIVRSHLDYLSNAIAQVDSAIDTMVSAFEITISLLRIIPGVDRNSTITIISEIGNKYVRVRLLKMFILFGWINLPPTMNLPARKSLLALHVPEYILNLH